MTVTIDNLPSYERISNEPIRTAAGAFDAAKAALSDAKRSTIQCQQELPQSIWLDAEVAEKARAEGKPEPKTRSHAVGHERRIANLEREQRVAQLATERCHCQLVEAIDKNGSAWEKEVEQACEALAAQWSAELTEMIALYGQLTVAFAVCSKVIPGKQPRSVVVDFEPTAVRGRDFASPQPPNARPQIRVDEILAGLSVIGTTEPDPEPVVQPPLPTGRGSALVRSQAGAEQEIEERRAFMERAAAQQTADA
jgi:hypothetical protein